ncbi:MAG: peptidoglycan glycosyltransferase [Porticoccaceae bacterium]|nr:MAG: peptidoglycan glycosyltransferase [Porticoccaceae bacterium]
MKPAPFPDPERDRRVVTRRLLASGLFVLLGCALLAARYYQLQVIRHQDFATQSEANRVHVLPLPPSRGLIFDRNGELLADNRPGFTLSVVVERAGDLSGLLARLDRLVDLSDEELARFERLKGRRKPYEPVPLRVSLSEEERSRIAVEEYRLPGVEVTAELIRHYPHGPLLAHVVGYVGRINERELETLDPVRYSGTYVVGKTGLEKYYEDALMGEVGYEYVETNARGRVMRVLERIPPAAGRDLVLGLDLRLQEAAWEALGDARGALAMLDVRSGAVLALVSKPSFDPNPFVSGIDAASYRALLESPGRPLFHRAIQGQYPPGSTVKPAFALAALAEGAMGLDTAIYDPGYFTLPGSSRRYRDWRKGGHGWVDVHDAIVQSCDTYFYTAGVRLGIERLARWGRAFGLGEPTGIDLPGESAGIMPDRAWKRAAKGRPWYPGDTVNASIGQGYVLATPLQLAVMAARLARRGERLVPRLALRVGEEPLALPLLAGRIEAPEADWDAVLDAMVDVVHGPRGTAKGIAAGLSYTIAGKTGTAQVYSLGQEETYDERRVAQHRRDHALFIAFAPAERPEVALGLIVENGGHGSSAAAPVARRVLDRYMALYHGDGGASDAAAR